MGHIYAFADKAHGHLHIMRGMPCEDASISFSEENKKYHIVAVADGHGAASCFRSNRGSEAAVEIAVKCLKEFAETKLVSADLEERFYIDMLENPRYQKMTLKELTDDIIAEWRDFVNTDYIKNPPTAEEICDSIDEYKDDKDIAHIYGTTLIAALRLPSCLILLQQGDGRCDVFYDDGTVDQPIPWDVRCEHNATTSMCDRDVAESFRRKYIDFSEKRVMACYLGSDGIEDAYRDKDEDLGNSHVRMGGVHTFYKDLTCQIATKNKKEFESFLKDMLSQFSERGRFSRSGSGDDISVAGIVDVEMIQKYIEQFQIDIKLYDLEEKLFWKEEELRGKARKHAILLKRQHKAEEKLNQEQKEQEELKDKIEQLEQELAQSKEELMQLEKELMQLEEEMEEYQRECEDIIGYIERKKKRKSRGDKRLLTLFLKNVIKTNERLYDEIDKMFRIKKIKYEKLARRVERREEDLCELKEKRQEGIENLFLLERNLKMARDNFEQYDSKCKEINKDINSIRGEIEVLSIVKN